MLERVHKGTYYHLTDDDKDFITKYFNERNLEELLEYCSAIALGASCTTWENAGLYLKDVGPKKFFRTCRNCGNTFDCEPDFAMNVCGDWYEKWIPLTEDQESRLKELENNIIQENLQNLKK